MNCIKNNFFKGIILVITITIFSAFTFSWNEIFTTSTNRVLKESSDGSSVGIKSVGDVLGFYTTLFQTNVSIDVVSFTKSISSTTSLTSTGAANINFVSSSAILPTNTSAYDPTSLNQDFVCLISREQQLLKYEEANNISGIVSLAPAISTAPVFLNNTLFAIDVRPNGYATGSMVNIDIVSIDLPTSLISGVSPFTFSPNIPYRFDHESMSSATNEIDEIYFVSGSNLVISNNPNPSTPNTCWVELDPTNQYSFYGLEYKSPKVLWALRYDNNTPTLDLVEIVLGNCTLQSIAVLYDLQANVAPSPPGWILNPEFYSTTIDTCEMKYYLSTLYDTNSSSRLMEIDPATSSHVEKIFSKYLFGIEMKEQMCETNSCCTDFDEFCNRLENAITFTIDPTNCKVTMNIDSLDCDDYIEYVDWGTIPPSIAQGDFTTGDMPMFTYPANGTYIISYPIKEIDSNGYICFEKILFDTINLMCMPSSIEELESGKIVNIYPNPTDNNLFIHFLDDATDKTSFEIKDASGKSVLNEFIHPQKSIYNLDVKDLNSGVYFLRILKNNNTIMLKKIIII